MVQQERSVRDPQFIMFVGPMFGSKTTRLLAAVDRLRWQHKEIVAFKPQMDDRYSIDKICTHSGGSIAATCVKTGDELMKAIEATNPNCNVIAVDEAFMIEGVAKTLLFYFKQGKTIIVSSLQLSSYGEPFEEIQKMMPWATKIEICSAVCPITGKDAYYSYCKVGKKDGDIFVGGSESYEPRCFEHHEFVNPNYKGEKGYEYT